MLFEPFTIRKTTLKNRVVLPPMVITKSDQYGYVTPYEEEHYRRMAEGGARLLIQEATCVNRTGKLCGTQLGIWEDGQIEGLNRLVRIAHENGAKMLVQLHHAGVKSFGDDIDAPFDFDMDLFGRHIRGSAMTSETAERIQRDFIRAGRRAWEAGYDGVEIHGAHGYLLSQLLNPGMNVRQDSLGTDPHSYVQTILEEIRRETDENFIIGIRIGGDRKSVV